MNVTGGGGADAEIAQSVIDIIDILNSDTNEIRVPVASKKIL